MHEPRTGIIVVVISPMLDRRCTHALSGDEELDTERLQAKITG
jgi:hypothetical protein